jgi:hypothetical protein
MRIGLPACDGDGFAIPKSSYLHGIDTTGYDTLEKMNKYKERK